MMGSCNRLIILNLKKLFRKKYLTFLQLHLDANSGRFALTATSGGKTVNIINLHSGEVLATGFGHSESICKAIFLDNGKFILTVR